MRLVIAGSMSLTSNQAEKVQVYLVHTLRQFDLSNLVLLVGDNPHGIDMIVRNIAKFYELPCEVWAANANIRCNLNHYKGFKAIQLNLAGYGSELYTKRDHAMIMRADEGLFISNGQTKYANGRTTGTIAGHQYMTNLGKPCELVTV